MERTLIPNSFQTPNVVTDLYMELLTPAESLIVVFLCRRTFGWGKWSDRVSVSQFCGEVRPAASATEAARRRGGTGLCRATVVQALAELKLYGVIEERAAASAGVAAEWALQLDLDRVDLAGLERRAAARAAKAEAGTAKARSAKQNEEPSVGQNEVQSVEQNEEKSTEQNEARSVEQTEAGLSGRNTETQAETHGETQAETQRAAPRRMWGMPRSGEDETASLSEIQALAAEAGIAEEVVTWAALQPQRMYWLGHWSAWVRVMKRISSPSAFVRSQVERACRGAMSSREAPREWNEVPGEGTSQGEPAKPRLSQPPAQAGRGPRVSAEAMELWQKWLLPQGPVMRGILQNATGVGKGEEGRLRVYFPPTALTMAVQRKAQMEQAARAGGVEVTVEFVASR